MSNIKERKKKKKSRPWSNNNRRYKRFGRPWVISTDEHLSPGFDFLIPAQDDRRFNSFMSALILNNRVSFLKSPGEIIGKCAAGWFFLF